MTETATHFHLHKFFSENQLMVINVCVCGDVLIEQKSQTTIFSLKKETRGDPNKNDYEVQTIGRGLIKRIYGLAANIPLDNEELHQIILAETGEEHIPNLTLEQARTITKRLKMIWDKKPDRVTKKQMGKIWKLGFMLHWSKSAVNNYCKRIIKKSNLFKLSTNEANNLIRAMESMIANDNRKK